MAKKVLPSIETGDDLGFAGYGALSNSSDGSYEESNHTPEPTNPEERLKWDRERYGEDWYRRTIAEREAVLKAQREREEHERIENKKLEDIRNLQKTNPIEYQRQKKIYKLQLKGLTPAQIERSNQPLPREEADRAWKIFKDLGAKPPTTNKHIDNPLRRRKSSKVSQTVKSTTRNRPMWTPAEVLADEESTPNATYVKVTRSKHDKTRPRKAYTGGRESRRIANKPVEWGIFANQPKKPVPKNLQRNPTGPRSKKPRSQ